MSSDLRVDFYVELPQGWSSEPTYVFRLMEGEGTELSTWSISALSFDFWGIDLADVCRLLVAERKGWWPQS